MKGHNGRTGVSCTLSPILSESEILEIRNSRRESPKKRKATSENREAARKRMATVENNEAARKRMATPENREADRKRKGTAENRDAARKRKQRKKDEKFLYKAWVMPDSDVQ